MITKVAYDDGSIYTLSNYQPHIDWHIATMKLKASMSSEFFTRKLTRLSFTERLRRHRSFQEVAQAQSLKLQVKLQEVDEASN